MAACLTTVTTDQEWYVCVSCLCLKDTDRVQVAFHYLHPAITALVRCLPCTPDASDLIHACTLWRMRQLLHALDILRILQRRLEAQRARDVRRMGFSRCHRKVFHPLVLHDACTLYAGCLAAAFFGEPAASALTDPCECGAVAWAATCTPPVITRGGRLMRDHVDECVAFCWACTRRRALATGGGGVRAAS